MRMLLANSAPTTATAGNAAPARASRNPQCVRGLRLHQADDCREEPETQGNVPCDIEGSNQIPERRVWQPFPCVRQEGDGCSAQHRNQHQPNDRAPDRNELTTQERTESAAKYGARSVEPSLAQPSTVSEVAHQQCQQCRCNEPERATCCTPEDEPTGTTVEGSPTVYFLHGVY